MKGTNCWRNSCKVSIFYLGLVQNVLPSCAICFVSKHNCTIELSFFLTEIVLKSVPVLCDLGEEKIVRSSKCTDFGLGFFAAGTLWLLSSRCRQQGEESTTFRGWGFNLGVRRLPSSHP